MPDPRTAAALALVLRRASATKRHEPRPRERIGPWSSSSYFKLASKNARWFHLSDLGRFVLGLLAVRSDDAGAVTFRRRDLLTLYGIEPGDVDDRPFLRALDSLIRDGWLGGRGAPRRTEHVPTPTSPRPPARAVGGLCP